jgi:hypothetical protein
MRRVSMPLSRGRIEAQRMSYAWIGQLLFVLCFLPLRLRVGQELGWERAWSEGIVVGFYFDALIAFLPWVLGRIFATASLRVELPLRFSLALFFWASSLANTLYFLFFQSKLHLWIVQDHWTDVALVQGGIGELSAAWPPVLSAALCLAAFFFWGLGARSDAAKRRAQHRGWRLTQGLLGFLLLVQLQQLPLAHRASLRRWIASAHDVNELRSVAYDHPIVAWATALLPQRPGPFMVQGSIRLLGLDEEGRRFPERWMAAFRDDFRQPPASYSAEAPLESDFVASAAARTAWLQTLGFSARKPLNVVYLYIESFRSFEYAHPVIGPAVFPGLRERVAKSAVNFGQTYSSVFAPGQTVRGLLTANCAFLENLLGPATVIGNPLTEMRCLQEFLVEHGYETYWLAAHSTTFHSKDRFELRHGTRHILAREQYIEKRKLPEDPFNLPDDVFFPAVFKRLESIHAAGKPFFMHTINVGTHMPWKPRRPEQLSPQVLDLVAQAPNKSYLGYLTSFHALDAALSGFIDTFLRSRMADDTVLVVMGDHSVPLEPPLNLAPVQREELKFRIPLFIFSKGLKRGLRFEAPVHQMDVSPTIATILGLNGPTTWVGRPLAPRNLSGTPWVYDDVARHLSYRHGQHSCYTLQGAETRSCYTLAAGQDPLFDVELSKVDEDLAQAQRYRAVAEASFLALSFNRISSHRSSSAPAANTREGLR